MEKKKDINRSVGIHGVEHARYAKLGLVSLGILCVTLLAFASSLGNDFVWDDRNFIAESPYIHDISKVGESFRHNIGYSGGARNNLYRPLFEALNNINFVVGGGKPLLFHITNILLHAGVAILVFFFMYIACGNIFVSAGTALIFAVHPIQTESVTYISGRADPLYSLFTFMSLALFAFYVKIKKNIALCILAFVSFVFALLSKEAALITPFLALFYAMTMLDKEERSSKRAIFGICGFFLIFVAYLLLRVTILDFSKLVIKTLDVPMQPLYLRMLTAAKAVFLYFRFLFLPAGFQMEVHLPDARSIMESNVFAACLGIIGLTGLLVYLKFKDKDLFFGLGWYFICLALVLNLFPINAKAAVHWLYLPSAGIFFALNLLLWRFLRANKIAFTTVILLFTILLGGLTFAKNFEWKNEETLFKKILPTSQTPRVYINLGNIYARKNELDKAEYNYLMALKIAPGQTEGYVNLGYVYNMKKQYPQAEAMLIRALQLTPKHSNAHHNLAVVYANTGRLDLAISHAEKAIEYNPSQIMAYALLGELYQRAGRIEDSRRALESARRQVPWTEKN